MSELRTLKLTMTERFQYDPQKVDAIFSDLGIEAYGGTADARAIAVFEYLYESQFGNDVFWAGSGPDNGYEFEDFDPDA